MRFSKAVNHMTVVWLGSLEYRCRRQKDFQDRNRDDGRVAWSSTLVTVKIRLTWVFQERSGGNAGMVWIALLAS